jgi:hypothetical protein
MKELKRLITDFEEAQNSFQKQAQKAFKDSMKSFFEDNPEVKLIRWTQYSPFFNDGEECTFSVHCPMFTNAPNADDIDCGDYTGDDETVWTYGEDCYGDHVEPPPHLVQVLNEFEEVQQSDAFGQIAEAMFGNHVEVTITAAGITVDEYSHD